MAKILYEEKKKAYLLVNVLTNPPTLQNDTIFFEKSENV